jgi:hypothetical protein
VRYRCLGQPEQRINIRLITRSNCSVVMSANPPSCDIWYAALLTSTSIRPNSRTAVSTTR